MSDDRGDGQTIWVMSPAALLLMVITLLSVGCGIGAFVAGFLWG